MTIQYDGKFNIAVGRSAESKLWKNKTFTWSSFIKRIADNTVTNETYREFIAANKQEQGKIKDVGGYVGGYLRNGRRNPKNVMHRQLLTLDIDFAHADFWADFTLQFTNAAILHATHKHSKANPRYRLLMPLDRECTPDEYVAIARSVAGELGIELFDNTTFETNRLMFWPSTPKDVEYYMELQDGAWLCADDILDSYIDWTDTSLWPTSGQMLRELGANAKKQADPREKRGIVGAFCRTYSITEVIEKYLSEEYVATDHPDRYTYTQGSTAAGLIVYEDTFAYSHHGTDPCSGKTSNAFDLVRLHKFGYLDDENSTSAKPKSFAAMEELALKDKEVKKLIAAESLEQIRYDFAQDADDYLLDDEVEAQSDDIEWMTELEVDGKGKYLSSSANLNLILTNDVRLKEAFKLNEFDNKRYICKTLPWRRIAKPEPIKNVDYSGIRNYIETIYGITGVQKIDDALALEFEKQSFHPIKEYLEALDWDGINRIDYLLIDYFGTPDNVYTREAIRKSLVAAVARIYEPGCKFDLVLTLIGPQGTKKSSFVNKLGKEWYSDTFTTVHGKEAFEQLQGAWIMEIAEMAGFRKADQESVKHFISKQVDTYRPAYGRATETYPRQNIFIASSNKWELFSDPTGNRRFMPIDVQPDEVFKDVWHDLDGEVDQIWAEALSLYRSGEKLYLSNAAEVIAGKAQREHCEVDDRRGLIEYYLDRELPSNWAKMGIDERRMYLSDPEEFDATGEKRNRVCVAEIWCECLGKQKEDMSRYLTGGINDIMKSLTDWEYKPTTANFGVYGKQKYYQRKVKK
jgi:putative DNA primase/helicase